MNEEQTISTLILALSFKWQYADRRYFTSTALQSRLILLIGSSCSGKTSVATKIRERYKEIKMLDFDLVFQANISKALQNLDITVYNKLMKKYGDSCNDLIFNCRDARIWHSVGFSIEQAANYQRDAIAIAKQLATQTRRRIAEFAYKLIANYQTVICFVAGKNGYGDYTHLCATNILVFCTLNNLKWRVRFRNKFAKSQGDYDNLRNYAMVESQYQSIMQACNEKRIPITDMVDTGTNTPDKCAERIINGLPYGR